MLAKLDFAMLILLELSCGGVEYDFSVISMHALRKHLRAVLYSTASSNHSRVSGNRSDNALKPQSYSIYGAHARCWVRHIGRAQQAGLLDRIGIGTEPLAAVGVYRRYYVTIHSL